MASFQQTCANDTGKQCRALQELWHKMIMKEPANLVKTYTEGLMRAHESM